ncbi:MAG: ribonuclease H-like domain-containing protein [candidate division Zixibacteria bacterium]|nr:ribonuclease H-like domain-containing protein [candidate division Zixibacteria bacterium]
MKNDALKDRLSRHRGHIVPSGKNETQSRPPEAYSRLAEELGGRILTNFAGSFCVVRKTYPFTYVHGDTALADVAGESSWPMSAFSVEEISATVSPSGLLFVDTETTGLGGAGAVAFLIGCGLVVSTGFEVRQYLIPDYSDETAMLEALLEEFSADRSLVTYNGAAFDLPLMRDRMIINRVAREIAYDRHIDLLHPARRLFRRRLADCTLTNIERELLGFFRQDDIPGYLIPSVYFEWLSERNANGLAGVLEHNRLDIISMYFLAGRIAEIYRHEGRTLTHTDDLHSLSRVYGRRRKTAKVVELYQRMNQDSEAALAEDILWYHSVALKRTGETQKALDIWSGLAQNDSREGYLANLELSKYFEHRLKDFKTALQHARAARSSPDLTDSRRRQLDNRIKRLRSRLGHG